jgi:protein SCO1/2
MWSFVTGDRDAIDRFAGAFGVSIIREDADLKEIVHNLRTAVIDPQGRVVEVFTGNEWTAEELLTSLRRAGA